MANVVTKCGITIHSSMLLRHESHCKDCEATIDEENGMSDIEGLEPIFKVGKHNTQLQTAHSVGILMNDTDQESDLSSLCENDTDFDMDTEQLDELDEKQNDVKHHTKPPNLSLEDELVGWKSQHFISIVAFDHLAKILRTSNVPIAMYKTIKERNSNDEWYIDVEILNPSTITGNSEFALTMAIASPCLVAQSILKRLGTNDDLFLLEKQPTLSEIVGGSNYHELFDAIQEKHGENAYPLVLHLFCDATRKGKAYYTVYVLSIGNYSVEVGLTDDNKGLLALVPELDLSALPKPKRKLVYDEVSFGISEVLLDSIKTDAETGFEWTLSSGRDVLLFPAIESSIFDMLEGSRFFGVTTFSCFWCDSNKEDVARGRFGRRRTDRTHRRHIETVLRAPTLQQQQKLAVKFSTHPQLYHPNIKFKNKILYPKRNGFLSTYNFDILHTISAGYDNWVIETTQKVLMMPGSKSMPTNTVDQLTQRLKAIPFAAIGSNPLSNLVEDISSMSSIHCVEKDSYVHQLSFILTEDMICIEDIEMGELLDMLTESRLVLALVHLRTYTKDLVQHLKNCIDAALSTLDDMRRKLGLSAISNTPKGHMMRHMHEGVIAHGSLNRVSTMTFEGFHKTVKKYAGMTNNRKTGPNNAHKQILEQDRIRLVTPILSTSEKATAPFLLLNAKQHSTKSELAMALISSIKEYSPAFQSVDPQFIISTVNNLPNEKIRSSQTLQIHGLIGMSEVGNNISSGHWIELKWDDSSAQVPLFAAKLLHVIQVRGEDMKTMVLVHSLECIDEKDEAAANIMSVPLLQLRSRQDDLMMVDASAIVGRLWVQPSLEYENEYFVPSELMVKIRRKWQRLTTSM